MVTGTKDVRFTVRDLEIFRDHFLQFRITTYEALRKMYWPEYQMDAVKKWVQRMRAAAFLSDAPLYTSGAIYLYPGVKAVRLLNLPPRLARTPDADLLAKLYGVLSFCVLGAADHRKISEKEFHDEFPDLDVQGLESNFYYLDEDFEAEGFSKQKRIGYIMVDSGKQPKDLRRRMNALISRRLLSPPWYDCIRRRRFIIAVATTTEAKKRRLQQALVPPTATVPLRITVHEDLHRVIPASKLHAPQRQDNS
ncbi:MAG: hypothetical protein HY287_02455 [Planctomycetes bacterium]|nr:hypothetical protein [Planctomycetota bacterium]MBI3833171.1 hypothetical protein [Planctomycetota bacterium]